MFARSRTLSNPAPETTPFQALSAIGLRAFQSANYGSDNLENFAEKLIKSGWVKRPNLEQDCQLASGVIAAFSKLTKLDLVTVSQTKQGVIRDLDLDGLVKHAQRYVAEAPNHDARYFGLDDGSFLALSETPGGFSLAAFLNHAHIAEARALARETTFYDAALQSLPEDCVPQFQVGRHTVMTPNPKPDFPTAVRFHSLPKTTLDAGEGAYASGKNTRWQLAFFDAEMAEFLKANGLAFAPISFELSQLQLR